jgi:hypothetical protein
MLVYKDGGPHKRQGGTYDYKLIAERDLDEHLAAGWHVTLVEIVEGERKALPVAKKKVKANAKLDQKTDSE